MIRKNGEKPKEPPDTKDEEPNRQPGNDMENSSKGEEMEQGNQTRKKHTTNQTKTLIMTMKTT